MAVGKIVATIIANSGPFTAGLKKAGSSAKGFSVTVAGAMKGLAKFGAAAIAAGAATLSALVIKGLKAVDAQAKLARSVDGTQRGLVGLTRAAKDAGVAEEDVGKAAQMLNRRLGEAQARVGLASRAFDTLGLSAKELSEMDVDERFAAISDAMNRAGMSSAQMSSTLGDLGIRTREMVLLMQGGGDAIRAATKEMDAYGVAVNEIDAAVIESVNDAWDRGTDALTGIANTMAVEVAPVIGALLKMFKDSSKEAGGFKDAIGDAFDAAVSGAGFVADAIHTIQIAFRAVQLFGQVAFAGIVSAGVVVGETFEDLIAGVVGLVNSAIEAFNLIPGIDIPTIDVGESEFLEGLRLLEKTSEEVALETQKALETLQDAPWPSDQLKAWVVEAKAAATEAAQAAIDERNRQKNMTGKIISDEDRLADERRAKELEQRRKDAEQKLADLEAFTRTEIETEQFAHEERLAAFRAATEALGLAQGERSALLEGLEEEHAKNLEGIRQKSLTGLEKLNEASWDQQLVALTGAGAGMVSAMQSMGEGMAKASKITGAAQAFISTLVGSAKALELPFPANLIAAATVATQGFALVAAIKSASFRGGGSKPAMATGGGAAAAAAGGGGGGGGGGAGPAGGTLTVSGLTGSALFSGETMSELVEELLEYQRQGGQVVLV